MVSVENQLAWMPSTIGADASRQQPQQLALPDMSAMNWFIESWRNELTRDWSLQKFECESHYVA